MGVKLQSALGGSVELNAPSTASNFTQVVPDSNGTVMIINNGAVVEQKPQFSSGVKLGANYYPWVTGSAEPWYRVNRGTGYKVLGLFELRSQNTGDNPGLTRYLDIRTNTTSSSLMYLFKVEGYLYNSGIINSISGGYTYTGNSILNQFTFNYGSSGAIITRAYRSSSGNLCLKVDSSTGGYTEGRVIISLHTHTGDQDDIEVTNWSNNNSSANAF